MKPAFSVIFLTTLIGAAQGLFLMLVGTQSLGLARLEFLVLGGAVCLVLAALGLFASFFHLGHPERAWRAATMWRTSWLSREVIALPVFMGSMLGWTLTLQLGWPGVALWAALGTLACVALFVCTAMIYASLKFLQEWASGERRRLIRRLGADLILFDSAGRYQTGIEMSREMAAKDSRYFLPRQFENELNVADHEHETGQEIIAQASGAIDAFVTGFGTGGTLAGCGRAIKKRWPRARIIAMEPAEQALLAGECPCCHYIEGVADGFLPPLLRAQ